MSSSRQLSTLTEIPLQLQTKLYQAGFVFIEDLKNVRVSHLSQCAEMTLEEAADILELVSSHFDMPSYFKDVKTVYDILQEELELVPLITSSQKLDEILNGGIPLKRITEVAGLAGAGKTQLCLQLCVNVQIPASYGGLAGQAIYIETEGSFAVSRLHDMAQACVDHCTSAMGNAENWTTRSVAENVFVYRCKELTDLLSCVSVLEEFLLTHNQVKLIVVDSLAFHFRHDVDSASERSCLLHKIAANLTNIAQKFKLAIVVTNQMTTRFDEKNQSFVTPSLGVSWAHIPSLRILLSKDPIHSLRWASITKCSYLSTQTAAFQVTKEGIRDVDLPEGAAYQPVVPESVEYGDGEEATVCETPKRKRDESGDNERDPEQTWDEMDFEIGFL